MANEKRKAAAPAVPAISTVDSGTQMLLRSLDSHIAADRRDLIAAMKWLASDLLNEVERLEKRPDSAPPCNGYVTCRGLTNTIDTTAARVYGLMYQRNEMAALVKGE